jgi:hypothetical protein
MKNKFLLSFFVILGMITSGQRPSLDLTFTAIDNAAHVKMDSIKVMNLTQGGDTLLYIGYANSHQSGITKAPESSHTYTFQFATNIPCPGAPIVEYQGQVYNTIQILSQCWLKENLNTGTFIPQNQQMSDNGILEKY